MQWVWVHWVLIMPLTCLLFQVVSSSAFIQVTLYDQLSPVMAPRLYLAGSTRGVAGHSHWTPKPFYITLCRQKNPALQENYASELCRVVILHLSRAVLTSFQWSAMITSTLRRSLRALKILYSSVRKTEVRTTCSRRLGRTFSSNIVHWQILWRSISFLYIKRHIYRRLQWTWSVFHRHYGARHGGATISWTILRRSSKPKLPYRCIYKPPSLDTLRLMNM